MTDDEMPEYNPHAKAALLQALQDQLTSPKTPEVKAELTRLVNAGVQEDEAKAMMATILAFHIASLLQSTKPFDYTAYLAELRRLPEVDYDQPL